jgi:hypothetical protein
MTDSVPSETPRADAPPRGKRGPKTPEGKARSSMNALRHGLRARAFGLLPEEDQAAFAGLVAELTTIYEPVDALERQLVDGIAVALWKELRADRLEAEVLADIAPAAPGRGHGTDLAEQVGGRTALATVLRYQSQGQTALRRAIDLLFRHRKARRDGLLREPPATDAIGTNEMPGRPVAPRPVPSTPGSPTHALDEPPAGPPAAAPGTAPTDPDGLRELRRQALLAKVRPALRPSLATTSLELLEQFTAAADPDPTVYEAWFAAQAKPPTTPLTLSAEDQALIRHVTRHNPPWLKGAYLGYYRPPVPRSAFAPEPPPAPPPCPPEVLPPDPAVPDPAARATLPGLQARLVRLLDRAQPRQPDELDLAEAVCALRWPNWPAYQGPIDLGLLRRALQDLPLDPDTLHWLGSTQLAQACREADHAPIMAQGP